MHQDAAAYYRCKSLQADKLWNAVRVFYAALGFGFA
jgi:hypothetical protein